MASLFSWTRLKPAVFSAKLTRPGLGTTLTTASTLAGAMRISATSSGLTAMISKPGGTLLMTPMFRIMRIFFSSLAWYNLLPDQTHKLLTAGYGTFESTGYVQGNDYCTAALTSDGTTAVIYLPTKHTTPPRRSSPSRRS